MSDLREVIEMAEKIDVPKFIGTPKAEAEAEKYRALGMTKVADRVLEEIRVRKVIDWCKDTSTPIVKIAKIHEFLARKSGNPFSDSGLGDNYLERSGLYKELRNWSESSAEQFMGKYGYYSVKRVKSYTYIIAVWIETPIAEYDAIPPVFVRERLAEVTSASLFDELTIASVQVEKVVVPDPLLIGRVNGWDSVAILAQWGDDIHVDDLI